MKAFELLGKRGQVGRLKRLAERALEQYGMEGAVLTPLWHMDNTTFRVDGVEGKRYVMRIQTPDGTAEVPGQVESELWSEVQWLAAIRRDTDLVVPVPVATRDGKLLTRVESEGVPGARVCVLFEWVYGRFLNRGLTAKHLEKVGAFTARLHEHVSKQFVLPDGFTRPRPGTLTDEEGERIIRTLAEVRSSEDMRVVERVIERVQGVLRELGEGANVFGLVHGDLHQWNYLFEGGEVRAIDFDDCGMSHFMYDVSVTLVKVKHRKDYEELKAGYLRGYRSVRKLSEEEEGYLESFFVLRDLQTINWYVEQRTHPTFTWWEEETDRGIERMRAFVGDRVNG